MHLADGAGSNQPNPNIVFALAELFQRFSPGPFGEQREELETGLKIERERSACQSWLRAYEDMNCLSRTPKSNGRYEVPQPATKNELVHLVHWSH